MLDTRIGVVLETPVRGVFIDEHDNLVVDAAGRPVIPLPEAGAAGEADTEVRPVAAGTLSVGGVQIKPLAGGDGQSPDLTQLLGMSDDLANTLKVLGTVIGAISGGVGAALTVIGALETLGLLGNHENPFDDLYRRLEQRLKHQLKSTLAGQTLSTMQHLDTLMGHAETAGQFVADYLRNPTPARIAVLPQADYWSRYAVNTVRLPSAWLRTYDDDAATLKREGHPGWQFGPVVGAGGAAGQDLLMWDWRLSLLAYLKIVAARVAVIHAIDPGVDAPHADELRDQADFVRGVEQRIRGGFSRSVPVPDPGWDYWTMVARDPCGVIEVQSGLGDFTGGFMPTYWWRDEIESQYARTHALPTTYAEYVAWHTNGVDKRYWRLYDKLGLFNLWTVISDLRAAAVGRPGVSTHLGSAAATRFGLSTFVAPTGSTKARLTAWKRWSG